MSSPRRIAIVGASLAGVRAIRALRRREYDRDIVLVGAEPHLPYDRPPLSKDFLAGERDAASLLLESEDFYEDVELRLGSPATALVPRERRVTLADGSGITADHVIIATGARPRPLPDTAARPGLHVLRTLDDAEALRDDLDRAEHVVIIGAGFIGAEVAATARSRGLEVTMLEALAAPVVRGVGPEIGNLLADLHRDRGVDLRLGVSVEAVVGDDRVRAVRLGDGTSIPADVVVVGIGAVPNVEWLEGSGIPVDNGVRCDATGRVAGVGSVWAAGDVANWHHAQYDERMRIEHWTNAADMGVAVANAILDGHGAKPFTPLPYVWSDQYDTKIQVLGRVSGEDDVRVAAGSVDDGRFVATYERGGRLRGVVGFSWARAVMSFRPLLDEAATSDAVRAHVESLG